MTGDPVIDMQQWSECSERLAAAILELLEIKGEDTEAAQDQAWQGAKGAVKHYINMRAEGGGSILDDPAEEDHHQERINSLWGLLYPGLTRIRKDAP
jgi:hypothetical protein